MRNKEKTIDRSLVVLGFGCIACLGTACDTDGPVVLSFKDHPNALHRTLRFSFLFFFSIDRLFVVDRRQKCTDAVTLFSRIIRWYQLSFIRESFLFISTAGRQHERCSFKHFITFLLNSMKLGERDSPFLVNFNRYFRFTSTNVIDRITF